MKVFDFLDPYLALQTYYKDRKNLDPKFSYATWAAELGLKSSSTLRMMVFRKKRISNGLAEKFSENNLTEAEERLYFSLLVTYTHAASVPAKNVAWKALSSILLSKVECKEVAHYFTFVSDLILPKLATLLSFDDQKWAEENLREVLQVDLPFLQESLKTLESIGLIEAIEEHDRKYWKSKDQKLVVSDKLGDLALRAYHDACLDEAKQAQSLPVHERKYRSLILPLTAEEFGSLSEEVNQFIKELVVKYQSDKYQDRRLYKLNLNYFPVSEQVSQEPNAIHSRS